MSVTSAYRNNKIPASCILSWENEWSSCRKESIEKNPWLECRSGTHALVHKGDGQMGALSSCRLGLLFTAKTCTKLSCHTWSPHWILHSNVSVITPATSPNKLLLFAAQWVENKDKNFFYFTYFLNLLLSLHFPLFLSRGLLSWINLTISVK